MLLNQGQMKTAILGCMVGDMCQKLLIPLVLELEKAYKEAQMDPAFQDELDY